MGDRPRCHNRVPFAGIWAPNGPGRLRWIEHRMSDRCAAWDSGPSPISESVPARGKWNCAGCRWLPAAAEAHLRLNIRLIGPFRLPKWNTNEFGLVIVDSDSESARPAAVSGVMAECQIRTSPPESKL